MPDPNETSRSPFARVFARMFAIDTRTLALFRIVLGAVLLFDLLARAQHLEAFYTDAGLIPLATRSAFDPSFSIHWLSGSFTFEAALFALHIAAAIAFAIGYRTPLATFVCWALLTSLHFRGPHLNDGGDAIARMMLLWSIFLPLGARFSIDASRSSAAAVGRVLSPASVGLLLQFVLFYMVAGISKSGPAWLDGSAVAAAIDNSYWSRPFGDAALAYPAVLEFLTYASRAYEILGPLLLFVPVFTPQLRLAAILGFWCFQLGLATALQLNLFPFFSSAATLVFVPGWFWNRCFPATARDVEAAPARSARALAEGWVVGVLLVAGLTLAGATLGRVAAPRWLAETARYIGFEQSWTMYAPHPPIFDLHFRVLGHARSGEILTLVGSSDDAEPSAAWREIVDFHRGYRLKDHLEHLMFRGREADPLRHSYLDWVCRSWNAAHPDRPIDNAAFVALSRRTLADRATSEAPRMLAERSCSAAASSSSR